MFPVRFFFCLWFLLLGSSPLCNLYFVIVVFYLGRNQILHFWKLFFFLQIVNWKFDAIKINCCILQVTWILGMTMTLSRRTLPRSLAPSDWLSRCTDVNMRLSCDQVPPVPTYSLVYISIYFLFFYKCNLWLYSHRSLIRAISEEDVRV